jgi:hypothetical protein
MPLLGKYPLGDVAVDKLVVFAVVFRGLVPAHVPADAGTVGFAIKLIVGVVVPTPVIPVLMM